MRSSLVFLAALALASAAPKSFNIKYALDGRIVGGEDTDITAHPHQISLEWNGSHLCGGCIIADIYVVTAAHCTDGSAPTDLQVRAGTTYIQSGGVVVAVEHVHQHPNYDSATTDFDISILHLIEPLTLSDSIQAIALPAGTTDQLPAGTEVEVTGWGATSEGGSISQNLQKVLVNIVDIEECRVAYTGGTISDNMLCAGVPEGGKDSCQGDSGGPLAANNVLYGLVSWGLGCARPGFPGIYTNVATLRDYITEITGL